MTSPGTPTMVDAGLFSPLKNCTLALVVRGHSLTADVHDIGANLHNVFRRGARRLQLPPQIGKGVLHLQLEIIGNLAVSDSHLPGDRKSSSRRRGSS